MPQAHALQIAQPSRPPSSSPRHAHGVDGCSATFVTAQTPSSALPATPAHAKLHALINDGLVSNSEPVHVHNPLVTGCPLSVCHG